LSSTSSTRNGGNSAGSVIGWVRPACHRSHAAREASAVGECSDKRVVVRPVAPAAAALRVPARTAADFPGERPADDRPEVVFPEAGLAVRVC